MTSSPIYRPHSLRHAIAAVVIHWNDKLKNYLGTDSVGAAGSSSSPSAVRQRRAALLFQSKSRCTQGPCCRRSGQFVASLPIAATPPITFAASVQCSKPIGEYRIVHLLATNAGRYITYRSIYDRLTYEGFIGGVGNTGYRVNVRSAIKRIRNKFRACDPTFDEIENYTAFGYCWADPWRAPG
jgi:hypothetical protein